MATENQISTVEQASQVSITKYTKESKELFDGHIKMIQGQFNKAVEISSANIREKQIKDLKALQLQNEETITKKILGILLKRSTLLYVKNCKL
jgi:hypothetical protein